MRQWRLTLGVLRTSKSPCKHALICLPRAPVDISSCSRLRAMMERMAERLPSPVEVDHEHQERQLNEATEIPTTLRAEIRIFPQFKELREDLQVIDVAVEVEGVLHNRQTLSTPTIDVIFVVDNG